MVQTRPRFGGGTNMENQASEKVFLPTELGKETLSAGTQNVCQKIDFDSARLQVLLDDHFKMEDATTEGHETERSTVHQKQNQQQNETEVGEKSMQEPKYISQHPASHGKPNGQDFRSPNDTCIGFQKECPPKANEINVGLLSKEKLSLNLCNDVSDEHLYKTRPNKEEIDQLVSLLKSLGIHVTVKNYTRTSSKTQDGMDDRESQADNADNYRPLGLTSASFICKKSAAECYKTKNEHFCRDVLYCKNLFLKDRKANYYFVIADESASVDLKKLKQQLHVARNLSFADVTATKKILGQISGAINPFAARLESARNVRFILHQSLVEAKLSKTLLAFHPLDGSLQVDMTVDELTTFLNHSGHRLELLSAIIGTDKGSDHSVSENLQGANKMELNTAQPELMHMKEEKINIVDQKDRGEDEVFSNSTTGKTILTLTQTEHDNSMTFQTKDDSSKGSDSSSLISETVENLKTPLVKKQPVLNIYTRKGKLKSFLKKTTKARTEKDNGQVNVDLSVDEKDDKDSKMKAIAPRPLAPQQNIDEKDIKKHFVLTIDEPDEGKQEQHVDKQSSSSLLPEIIEFYDRLTNLGIQYHDICLQTSTTRDIGPSLGCKCFFLKDRSPNFYLIITHEYYEMDYGRLKQALKPHKKLDQSEPADILDRLGVQPFRVTPFSCTSDRAVTKNVRVFITEKIHPPEVVLCIQHPFSDGRRLIMTSGDLQRYLSLYHGPQIKTVREKLWPDKFNWLFTRFTDQLDKSVTPFMPSLPASAQKEATTDIITSETFENEEQMNLNQMKLANDGISLTEDYRNDFMFNTNPFLLIVCQRMSKNFLNVIGTIIPWDVKHDQGSLKFHRIERKVPRSEGSSVDPALDLSPEETHCMSQSVSQEDKYVPSMTRKKEESVAALDVKIERKNLDIRDFRQRSSSFKINKPLDKEVILFSVESVLDHLQETDIEFSFIKMSENIEDKSLHKIDLHNRLLKEEVNDNVETCSTSYLCDNNDNYYIIVGGESDFITVRRFARIFHLPGRPQVCKLHNIGELNITPFSVIQALKKRLRHNIDAKIYFILFTSLYIDPTTTCLFHLDQKGSIVQLMSSELEKYILKMGMEVWYMP